MHLPVRHYFASGHARVLELFAVIPAKIERERPEIAMIGGSDHFILYDNPKALYDEMGDLPAGEKRR